MVRTFFTIITLLIAVAVAAWILGWIAAPFGIGSYSNVREQYGAAYQNSEALKATAINVCSAEKAVAAATSDSERSQRQTQVLAFEQNYARIAASYNAAMANAFAAKYVRPSDLPEHAPTLAETKAKVCAQ